MDKKKSRKKILDGVAAGRMPADNGRNNSKGEEGKQAIAAQDKQDQENMIPVAKATELLQAMYSTNLVQIAVLRPQLDAAGKIIDFCIVFVNKELETLTNRSDLIGKFYGQVYPGIYRSGVFDQMLRVFNTGSPERMEYYYPYDGFDKWFLSMFVKTGEGLMSMNLDISRYKSAEAATLKSTNLLRQSEELAGSGSWEYQMKNREFRWSRGMYLMFEIPENSVITPAIYLDRCVPEDQDKARLLVKNIETGSGQFEEILRVRAGATIKTLKIKAEGLKDINGITETVLGVDIDMTSIVQSHEKIHELNKHLLRSNRQLTSLHSELATFNAIAANDYRETLKKLYTIFEFIVTGDARNLSNESKANLRRGQSAVQRMKLLTEDVLAYSSIHTLATEMEKVDLNEILHSIYEDLLKNNPEVKIVLEYDQLAEIMGFPVLLTLMFHHFLTNSIKFRKDDENVFVKIQNSRVNGLMINHADASPSVWYNLISIADQGIGFDIESSKKLFTMFSRFHDKAKYKGSGIGLAVCQKIMDIHDGFITAYAKVDEGATFNLYFPIPSN